MENNYSEVFTSIAKFILDNRPEGLKKYDLEHLIECTQEGSYCERISLEFRRALDDRTEANVSLDISNGQCYDNGCGAHFDDDEGNTWKKMQYEFRVNWPSYGSASLKQAAFRIELMKEIIAFAEILTAKFSEPCYRFLVSKADKEAANAALTRAANLRILTAAFDIEGREARKGMRVSSDVRLFKILPGRKVEPGAYKVSRLGKEYDIEVPASSENGETICSFIRTK